MIYYVSTPTGEECLALCRQYGYREMACPITRRKNKHGDYVIARRGTTPNLDHYALDNGAWIYHEAGVPGDFGPFVEALAKIGRDADFVVVPDMVAGGGASLRLSEAWLPLVLHSTRLALVPVQDGMQPRDVEHLIGERVGLFVGGSDAWKWTHVADWVHWAVDRQIYIHVGRVNGEQRSMRCADLGANSADGSTVSRWPIANAHLMEEATRADRHSQVHIRLESFDPGVPGGPPLPTESRPHIPAPRDVVRAGHDDGDSI